MRRSTFYSFLVAAILAVLAVVGVQSWLSSERQNILQQALQSTGSEKPSTQVVVASTPLRFGERVTASKLKLIDWPGDSIPSGAFVSLETVVGESEESARYVLSAIEVDEPVLRSKITIPGQKAKLSTALRAGMKAVTIRVNDVSGIAGFVLPGDRVDVLLTRGSRNGGSVVDVLLQGVNVLAIDQLADDRADKPSLSRTITFEVSTEEAQKLILGSQIGSLSLALRNVGSSEIEAPERMSVTDLFDDTASESLTQEIASQEVADDGRLLGIEEAVKTVDQRINEVEEALRSEVEQALLKNQQAAEAETVVEPVKAAPPPEPSFIKVFVTKNGRQVEYRFRAN